MARHEDVNTNATKKAIAQIASDLVILSAKGNNFSYSNRNGVFKYGGVLPIKYSYRLMKDDNGITPYMFIDCGLPKEKEDEPSDFLTGMDKAISSEFRPVTEYEEYIPGKGRKVFASISIACNVPPAYKFDKRVGFIVEKGKKGLEQLINAYNSACREYKLQQVLPNPPIF